MIDSEAPILPLTILITRRLLFVFCVVSEKKIINHLLFETHLCLLTCVLVEFVWILLKCVCRCFLETRVCMILHNWKLLLSIYYTQVSLLDFLTGYSLNSECTCCKTSIWPSDGLRDTVLRNRILDHVLSASHGHGHRQSTWCRKFGEVRICVFEIPMLIAVSLYFVCVKDSKLSCNIQAKIFLACDPEKCHFHGCIRTGII